MKWAKLKAEVLCLLFFVASLQAFQPSFHHKAAPARAILLNKSNSRLHSTATAAENVAEGLVKTVLQTGQGNQVNLGDIATVKYSCYLPDDPKALPFSKASQQKVAVGDLTMIKGWDKAIRTMKVGERAVIRISDPSLAYGDAGFPPLIPPRAEIEMDIEILDAQPPTQNIDFDNLANANNTPVRNYLLVLWDDGRNTSFLGGWIFVCFQSLTAHQQTFSKSNS